MDGNPRRRVMTKVRKSTALWALPLLILSGMGCDSYNSKRVSVQLLSPVGAPCGSLNLKGNLQARPFPGGFNEEDFAFGQFFSNSVSAGCSTPGMDVVYSVQIAAAGYYFAIAAMPEVECASRLSLWSGCPGSGTLLACSDDVGEGKGMFFGVPYEFDAAGTYYLLLDTECDPSEFVDEEWHHALAVFSDLPV
jgi:hypothetical protein